MIQLTQFLTKSEDRNERAKELVKQSALMNFAKMDSILIELFGCNPAFKRIGKREGQIVEMYFIDLEGSIHFKLVSDQNQFQCRFGKPENPIAIITVKGEREKAIKIVSKVICLKDNIFGLIKILPLFIKRKIKIKGSYIAAIKLCRCMMVGKHPMYKRKVEAYSWL